MADPRPLLLAAALLAGCAKSVIPEYEARREVTLAPPREVPADWSPDAVVILTEPVVDALISEGLTRSGTFRRKVALGGRAHFTPDLALKGLSLTPSKACRACLGVRAELEGVASWRLGNSKGERPLSGHMVFDVELAARRDDGGRDWVVTAMPRGVREAELEMGGRTFRTVAAMADAAIQDWATKHVFDALEPLVLTRHEGPDLPLRALRVRPHEGTALRLDLLTEAPILELADPAEPRAGETWTLSLSQAALLHVARREAFTRGPVAQDVVPEPVGLTVGDGTFTLDLRLWRLKGRGWWRDLLVQGSFARTDDGFDLQAVEAEEVARSRGARVVDPMAALGEGLILQAVEKAITTTLPGGTDGQVAGIPVKVQVGRIGGTAQTLQVAGTAVVAGRNTAQRAEGGGPRQSPGGGNR
jgi:hypothetical protein